MNIHPNPQSNIFFIYIDKEKSHRKRDAKKATQGIQYLYTHRQKGQKIKKYPTAQQTTLVRAKPINKINYS